MNRHDLIAKSRARLLAGHIQPAFELLRPFADGPALAGMLLQLQVEVYERHGKVALVLAAAEQAVEQAEKLGDEIGLTILLKSLAVFSLPWWRDAPAIERQQRLMGMRAAQRLIEMSGSPAEEHRSPAVFWIAGAHFMYEAAYGQALQCFRRGLSLARRSESRYEEALNLEGIGRLFCLAAHGAIGERWLAKARRRYAQIGDDYGVEEVDAFLYGLGESQGRRIEGSNR
jgi:hypothetical protein